MSSRPFKSCKLRGGLLILDFLFQQRCLIELRSEKSQGEIERNVVFLKPVLKHFFTVAGPIILLKEATAIGEFLLHEGVILISYNDYIGFKCQSNIYINGSTQASAAQSIRPPLLACLLL